MIEWWFILIPTAFALAFWYLYVRTANDRDKAVRAIQMVEAEYRIMSQCSAIFDKLQENHEKMEAHFEKLYKDASSE